MYPSKSRGESYIYWKQPDSSLWGSNVCWDIIIDMYVVIHMDLPADMEKEGMLSLTTTMTNHLHNQRF